MSTTPQHLTLTMTVADNKAELIALQVALGEYLRNFTRDQVANAHRTSCIGRTCRTYNRVYNILNGNNQECNVDKVPLLAYRQEQPIRERLLNLGCPVAVVDKVLPTADAAKVDALLAQYGSVKGGN